MKLIFVAFMLLFSGEAAFAYEQPKYEIVKIYKGFELRRYAPYIVAETVVSGKFDDAGNKAFRILFKYISGDNLKKTERLPKTRTPPALQNNPLVLFCTPTKTRSFIKLLTFEIKSPKTVPRTHFPASPKHSCAS